MIKSKPLSKNGEQMVAVVRALFRRADETFKTNAKMADRYVRKARRLAAKSRLSIPSTLSKKFCRFCGAYWMPGVTVRVRLQKSKVVYFCLKCKKYTRHPYCREKKARKAVKR